MGVVPFVFAEEGMSWQKLGLKGDETVTIKGLAEAKPKQKMEVEITDAAGKVTKVPVICRIDTLDEVDYVKHGGILHYVLRQLAA
jgi:aconitate hydratase